MPKIIRTDRYLLKGALSHDHYCPACDTTHGFAVDAPFHNANSWSFNGDFEKPTFNPSMNIKIGPFPDMHMEICHYFITDGKIRYMGDCTHKLVGQTIDLPEIPEKYLKYSKEVKS